MFRSVFRPQGLRFGASRSYASPSFPPSHLNLSVGKIVQCELHENADTLYVSQVVLSDSADVLPIQICSGLVKYLARDQLLGQQVVVLTNLKASKMRGIKSEAMLLAAERTTSPASTADGNGDSNVEVALVKPPVGSVVGERLFFGEFTSLECPSKLKSAVWLEIQLHLKTDCEGQVMYHDGHASYLKNAAGNVAVSLADSVVR